MTALLAQQLAGGSIAGWAIWAIVICGVLAILFAFIRYSGVQIPPLLVTVFWIVVAVIICVAGIKIIMSIT